MLLWWGKQNKWSPEESLQKSHSDWMHTEPRERALVVIAIRVGTDGMEDEECWMEWMGVLFFCNDVFIY